MILLTFLIEFELQLESGLELASEPQPELTPEPQPQLRYDHPCAIYERYIADREAWYKTLPQGSLKTNQQYRKTMGLPLRYSKEAYEYYLDYKRMGKQCAVRRPRRDWTKEEQIAYLDWEEKEDKRVEAQVTATMAEEAASGRSIRRRGMQDYWDTAERDVAEQQALYEASRLN